MERERSRRNGAKKSNFLFHERGVGDDWGLISSLDFSSDEGKDALHAGLACGRCLRVVSSGCVGARWFEDTSPASVAVAVREALFVYAGGALLL